MAKESWGQQKSAVSDPRSHICQRRSMRSWLYRCGLWPQASFMFTERKEEYIFNDINLLLIHLFNSNTSNFLSLHLYFVNPLAAVCSPLSSIAWVPYVVWMSYGNVFAFDPLHWPWLFAFANCSPGNCVLLFRCNFGPVMQLRIRTGCTSFLTLCNLRQATWKHCSTSRKGEHVEGRQEIECSSRQVQSK